MIGSCHNVNHPGKLTKRLLEEHQCLAKGCTLLERYEDAPFWAEHKRRQFAKEEAKRQKREKKARARAEAATLSKLREDFQRCADDIGSELDVIRIERLGSVSEWKFCCFPDNQRRKNRWFPKGGYRPLEVQSLG